MLLLWPDPPLQFLADGPPGSGSLRRSAWSRP
jgi:hypothetical protein